jgi:hypothetical protein
VCVGGEGGGGETTDGVGTEVLKFVSHLRDAWSDFLQPAKEVPFTSPLSKFRALEGGGGGGGGGGVEDEQQHESNKLIIDDAAAIPREQIEVLNDTISTVSKAVNKTLSSRQENMLLTKASLTLVESDWYV